MLTKAKGDNGYTDNVKDRVLINGCTMAKNAGECKVHEIVRGKPITKAENDAAIKAEQAEFAEKAHKAEVDAK